MPAVAYLSKEEKGMYIQCCRRRDLFYIHGKELLYDEIILNFFFLMYTSYAKQSQTF